jgi:hippurate hydrolase
MDMYRRIAPAVALALLVATAGAAAAPVDLVSLYKDLHSHPELSLLEIRTAGILAAEARAAGFTVTEKVGGTGIVAVLVNGAGPTILIRTDMDGLPVAEATGLPYASTVTVAAADGTARPVMHACGHDMHMAAWVGVARAMATRRAEWSGTLVMIGQPAEEIGAGARAMLADGLFTRFPKPDFTLALHDDSRIPAGIVSVPANAALSVATSVDLKVRGIGGHGAYPATTKDPVVLAAQIVLALQTLVSRENDPFHPAVITVGSIHGGSKHNIIPDEVMLQITVRSYEPDQQRRLLAAIARVARGQTIAAGIPENLMPVMTSTSVAEPTRNTPALAARLTALFKAKLGPARVVDLDPSMASEDFSAFGRADPAIQTAIFWVGGVAQPAWEAAQAGGPAIPSLHNSRWAVDPAPTIATGVEAMTAAALLLLAKQ